MRQSINTPVANQTAINILERLKRVSPTAYAHVAASMQNRGMGAMGSILEDLTGAITGAISEAPAYFANKEQKERELEAAKGAAAFEINKAQIELQQQQLQAQTIQNQQMMALEQQRIAEEKRQLELAKQSLQLEKWQKTGLGVAAGLGILLIFLVGRRKGAF